MISGVLNFFHNSDLFRNSVTTITAITSNHIGMITPKIGMRDLKVENSSDPVYPSLHYVPHFEYLQISTAGKTITRLVLEVRITTTEAFIRNCHHQPDTYDFNNFRLTQSYKSYIELSGYLTRLSKWLYSETTVPHALRKAIAKKNAFLNPYRNFSLKVCTPEALRGLDNQMLTVAYNRNISEGRPSRKYTALIQKEFKKRGVDVSELRKNVSNAFIHKIEYTELNTKGRVSLLRGLQKLL